MSAVAARVGRRLLGFLLTVLRTRFAAVLLILIAVFTYFSVTEPQFLTTRNIQVLLAGAAVLWLVSMGLTFVLLSGGFDLSLGSLLALCGVAFGAFYIDLGIPALVAVTGAVAFGAVVGGAVNGVLIGRFGLNFLVVSLGTLILYRGVVNLWTGTETRGFSSSLLDTIAFDHFLGLPVPVWIMLTTFVIALYVQRNTFFGRDVYAVGGNPDAARLSGIRVSVTLVSVYAIAGAAAGAAGVLQAGRIGAVSPLVGETIIFDAAAAVLIGGTSFEGGIGGVGGTAVGVLLLGTLQNGLAIAGVDAAWQQVFSGGILVLAVIVNKLQRSGRFRRRERGSRTAAPPPPEDREPVPELSEEVGASPEPEEPTRGP